MAKTNKNIASVSAAQRREQERSQRQQRLNEANRKKSSSGKARNKQVSRTPWLVGGLIGVAVVVIAIFVIVANMQGSSATQSATPTVFHSLTHIDQNTLDTVGAGSVQSAVSSTLKPVKNTPLLKGPHGKPELFYMGAEYCPFCAAQRWAMIVALSRFGTFTKAPTAIIAEEDSVPTYSFNGSVYQSSYIDFVPVEVEDNQSQPQPLQALTAQQTQLVNTYDAPPYTDASSAGSYPFLDFGNQHVSAGAYYSPTLLVGQPYNQILADIQDTSSDISTGVLGSANYMTAAICQMTDNQPGNVCNSSTIQQLQHHLANVVSASPQSQIAYAGGLSPLLVPSKQE